MAGERANFQGGCSCGAVRFEMTRTPLFVHCCHCTYCQRETGTSFGLNALIETSEVTLLQGATEPVELPTQSGKGQIIHRCSHCHGALWSHYGAGGDVVSFVRVGTLDEAAQVQPSLHIYTSSKQPWVTLSDEIPAVPEYYRAKEYWPAESLARAKAMRAG